MAKELFKVESKSAKEDLKQELGVSYSGIFIYPNLFWHRFFLFLKNVINLILKIKIEIKGFWRYNGRFGFLFHGC